MIAGSALGVVALGVLIVVGAILVRGRKSGPVEQLEHSNTVFSVRYSSDWKIDNGGMPLFEWVTFSKGSAKIKIRIHAADQFARATGIVPADPRLAAKQFHLERRSTYEEEFGKGYEEDEEPKEVASEAGSGFRSNFKAKAMFGSLRGVRATILGFVQINVTAQCSAGDWATFEPEFDRIIRSIGFPKVQPGGVDVEDE